MKMTEAFLLELEHEAANARRTIERVPEDKFGWKPHEKSMTFGRLASHIAEIPGWTVTTLKEEVFNITGSFKAFEAGDAKTLMKMFDDQLANAKAALKEAKDEDLGKTWKMIVNGETIVEMPRAAVIRSWVLNHMIHHRGQLTVYLRENNIPVPAR